MLGLVTAAAPAEPAKPKAPEEKIIKTCAGWIDCTGDKRPIFHEDCACYNGAMVEVSNGTASLIGLLMSLGPLGTLGGLLAACSDRRGCNTTALCWCIFHTITAHVYGWWANIHWGCDIGQYN